MRTILTPSDLRAVLDDDDRLPDALRRAVYDWYWAVWRQVGGDSAAFTLEPLGGIVIVEATDGPDGIPGACRKSAEWAEVHRFDGEPWFDVGVLEGDSKCWRVLGKVGNLHPTVEAWCAHQVLTGDP
jgi:hypothetical protein